MEPLRRSLGACLGLPSFAYFWKHFPTVISERNGILVCFEYETYLGYTASRCPSQTEFSFRASCCVQSWESGLLQLLFSFFFFFFLLFWFPSSSEVWVLPSPVRLVAAHSRNCILASATERHCRPQMSSLWLILVGAAMALAQTKLSKGVLKSKVPGDCAVKARHSNLSNPPCFRDGWGKGLRDYFSVTNFEAAFESGGLVWGFLMLLCYPGAFCLPCAVVPRALFQLECSVKGCTSWLST